MMALSHQPTANMTEIEYLAFERKSDIKHEYLKGEVFAMTGASETHNLICAYTIAALINALGDKPCRVYPSDMRVKVSATGLYTYPDISVVCGDSQFTDDDFDTLLNPIVILEVLSPTTEGYDRGKKFQHYREIKALREYSLISQDNPRIEHYVRQDNDIWMFTEAKGLSHSLELVSIDCRLALTDVYRKITFPPDNEDEK